MRLIKHHIVHVRYLKSIRPCREILLKFILLGTMWFMKYFIRLSWLWGKKVFLRHNNDAEFFRNQPEKKVISCKLMRMIRGHIVFFGALSRFTRWKELNWSFWFANCAFVLKRDLVLDQINASAEHELKSQCEIDQIVCSAHGKATLFHDDSSVSINTRPSH